MSEEEQEKLYSLYFNNFPKGTTEEELKEMITKVVEVKSVRIPPRRRREHSGYGFAEFFTEEDMNKALEELNGKVMGENTLVVEIAKSHAHPSGEAKSRRSRSEKRRERRRRSPPRRRRSSYDYDSDYDYDYDYRDSRRRRRGPSRRRHHYYRYSDDYDYDYDYDYRDSRRSRRRNHEPSR